MFYLSVAHRISVFRLIFVQVDRQFLLYSSNMAFADLLFLCEDLLTPPPQNKIHSGQVEM